MPPADGLARDWAVGCAQRESARTGIGSRKVWQRIAVRLGVSAGTMEGLVRGRTKMVSTAVYERIRCGVVRELEAELARVTHALEMARASGLDARSAAVSRAETAVAAARAAIEEALK